MCREENEQRWSSTSQVARCQRRPLGSCAPRGMIVGDCMKRSDESLQSPVHAQRGTAVMTTRQWRSWCMRHNVEASGATRLDRRACRIAIATQAQRASAYQHRHLQHNSHDKKAHCSGAAGACATSCRPGCVRGRIARSCVTCPQCAPVMCNGAYL